MKAIHQVQALLGLRSAKESIVINLLKKGHISPEESTVLLRGDLHVNITVADMSSGAKVIVGEDNEIEYRQ